MKPETIFRKAFESWPEAISPTEDALKAVRKFATRDVAADDVFLGRMKLANTDYDRSHERFTKAHLDRFAETLPGRSVMPGHNYQELPVARFYAATVVQRAGGGHHLVADYYATRKNEELISAIELGVLKDVSIGFRADKLTCDLCDGADYEGKAGGCTHIAGQEYDGKLATVTYGGDLSKYEAVEGSFVWLGCQYGAETMGAAEAIHKAKAALLAEHSAAKGDEMELKEALAEIDRLKAELAKAGDAALAADGKAYREHLKSEITRMAGQVEKTGTYAAVLKHMESADSSSLVPIVDELKKEVEIKFPPATHGKAADPPPAGTANGQTPADSGQRKTFDPRKRAPIPAPKAA
jgi:hypothetical protein